MEKEKKKEMEREKYYKGVTEVTPPPHNSFL